MLRLKKLPVEGFLLDFLLLTLVVGRLFSTDYRWELTLDSYRYLYWSVGILQCLALYAVFSGDIDIADEKSSSFVARILSPISGLLMVLSLGAFVWIFIPAAAVGAQGSVVANFIIVLFGSWIALGVSLERRFDSSNVWHRGVTTIFVLGYLSASESLLLFAADTQAVGRVAAVFGALFSYLPIRLMLILRAPVSDLEALSALGSFGCFIYALIVM